MEEIQGIVYDCKQRGIQSNQIQKEVLMKIVPTFSQDIIAFSVISMLNLKNKDLLNMIIEIYKEVPNLSLTYFIKKTISLKNVVYTFSSILEPFSICDNFQTESLNVIGKHSIKEILVYSISSEGELEKELDDFYSKENQKICIIRCRPCDCLHLNHLQYFIDDMEKNHTKERKMFIFLIHIDRKVVGKISENIKNEYLISHLSQYNQLFIDSINGESNIKVNELLSYSNEQLFKEFINKEEVFNSNIYKSFMKLKYNFKNKGA